MIYYLPVTHDNGFWKVCEALDCPTRVEMLRHLMEIEKTAFPCVSELAELFTLSEPATSVHLKKLSLAGLVDASRVRKEVSGLSFFSRLGIILMQCASLTLSTCAGPLYRAVRLKKAK